MITDRAGQPIRSVVSGKLVSMYLEYPKAVYLGGDVTNESIVVKNADEEADAAGRGYEALPANPPPDAAQPGGPLHLPYPKIVYLDGDLSKDSRRVESADEEAAAGADGFLAFVHPSAAPADDESDEDNAGNVDVSKPRRGRKKK